VICDAQKAHLFYTSLDAICGDAKRRKRTSLRAGPAPQLALKADIFEASHTYKLKGMNRYLTIVEAQGDRRRYYQGLPGGRLEGPWKGLADSQVRPFAGLANVQQDEPWTANISHGELIRADTDEMMEIDPAKLRFLFQGASDAAYRNKPYGQIPGVWEFWIRSTDRWAPSSGPLLNSLVVLKAEVASSCLPGSLIRSEESEFFGGDSSCAVLFVLRLWADCATAGCAPAPVKRRPPGNSRSLWRRSRSSGSRVPIPPVPAPGL